MLAAASEKINGIVNKMPNPETTQIAVIAMGRLEGEAGSDSGCSVITFFCLTAGWGIAMATWKHVSIKRNQRRHRERSVAIQGPPPQPRDPLDRHVASLLAMTIPSKRDVL